jgi:cytochrome b6-f complex iron-sulfur subunit
MDRKEFLTALGYSSGALIFAACLGGCKKDSTSSPSIVAPVVDFTLDLTLPANSALNTIGGFIYSNGVIVAKTTAGNIIAVSQACTHQGTTVQFQGTNNQFFCPNHGSTFNTNGGVTLGPASSALKQYNVTITSNSVRVNG